MFGGLELKGASPNEADDAADNATAQAPAPAPTPALSSFGFMNVDVPAPTPAPDPVPAQAPVVGLSSFSFLNSIPVEPQPQPLPQPLASASASALAADVVTPIEAPPPAPAVSGFSFMMQEPTPNTTTNTTRNTTATTTTGAAAAAATTTTIEPSFEVTPPDALDSTPAVVSSSGFDFMNAMTTTPAPAMETPAPPAIVEEERIIPTIAEEAPAAPPAISGFSFLADNTAAMPSSDEQPELPATIHTRTNSHGSISSALSTPSLPSAPTQTPVVPAMTTGGGIVGAGVTFGTSSAKPRIKKKKIRSSKIGIGASHADATTPVTAVTPVTAAPAPPPASAVPAPAPAPVENEAKSARDAALEATKKAEAFMQSKAMKEARVPEATTKSAPERAEDLELKTTASTDEVLAAAKEAAQKAKIIQHQHKGKTSGGFMGTFFKGFRASPVPTSSGATANGSKHSVGSNSSANASGMDRLAKEQKVMKQAIAERQLQQHQQHQQQESKQPQVVSKGSDDNGDDDDDDDEVVVFTNADGYKPAETTPPPPPPPPPPSVEPVTFTPAAPPAVSQSSSFVPAKIPSSLQPKATPSFQPVVVPTYGVARKSPPAPVPVPVPKKNTPKDIFEGYQEQFSQSVNSAMRKVEDARNLKKGLLEERFVAMAKNRFATREIEQIEELLQTAIDEEDYEQADELGQRLDAHQREKNEVVMMLQNNENALERLASEKISLGEMIASCFEHLAAKLDELKTKEIASEKKDDNEILTQYATISKQLSEEHERLQQDLKHLERDEQLVAEERKELEDSINEQTGEIETEKENACAKLKEVEQEIEELRKALENKQKEAASLRTKMFGFEDSISKVRVKFSRQLNRVNNKEMTVKQNRREWEIENEQYTKQKEAHDLQVENHSNALLAHEELMETLESELKLSREFSEIIPAKVGFMVESEAEENDSEDEGSLAQLKANVVKCEGAVDAAKKELKMATMAIQNLETERDVLMANIPVLEKQKKAAAAGRDFKSAGKYSKEIKDAASRIKECEDELNDDAKAKKATAEAQLRELDSDLLEANKIADAKEKVSGEKRMVTLAKKIEELEKEKTERCGEDSSEGNTVKSVAARVIESQVAMLRAEGSELGSKYGGWDNLLNNSNPNNSNPEQGEGPSSAIENSGSQEKIDSGLSAEEMRERLAKAKALIAKCADLEEKVYEAADREDFDAAGKFQEELDQVNNEIEEMNITDEECELLAQEEATLDAVPPTEAEESGVTTEEQTAKAKQLITKQSELEEKVQDAAEEEDFEAAEEFQTELDRVISELEELNIPDDLKALLTKDEDDVPFASEDEQAKETVSDADGEEKKENPDEEQDQDSVDAPVVAENVQSTEPEGPEEATDATPPESSEEMEVEVESEAVVEEQQEPGDTVEASEVEDVSPVDDEA